MTVSETIRQERKKAGLSQAELGKRLGVSQSMIAQYECGIRKPKMTTIQLIADALGADIELFLQAIIDEAAEVVERAPTSFCFFQQMKCLRLLPQQPLLFSPGF